MSVSTALSDCLSYQISLTKYWYQLSTSEKGYFLDLAKDHSYQDPKHPSGRSKGYCFYLALQRKMAQFKENR
jgi:hypothetical protein